MALIWTAKEGGLTRRPLWDRVLVENKVRLCHNVTRIVTFTFLLGTTRLTLYNNPIMPLGVPPYPVLDTDPHATRVVRYFRLSDYLTWASVTVGMPAALAFWCTLQRPFPSDTNTELVL